jgi:hypothetical protein
MELELKHIAPYFRYGLKMTFREGGRISTLQAMYNYTHETHPIRLVLDGMDSEHIWMFKPILKPLSEFNPLTIETDDKIKEFVGRRYWCDAYDDFLYVYANDMANLDTRLLQAPYPIFNYLLSQHYDVFGLIPKRLAISVNDLKKQ